MESKVRSNSLIDGCEFFLTPCDKFEIDGRVCVPITHTRCFEGLILATSNAIAIFSAGRASGKS